MENTQQPINSLLESFQKQKVSQESEVLLSAQRFINQFRALRLFKPEYTDQFNQKLLQCAPDVRRFFSSLMGGSEVRSYLEFLEKQQPSAATEQEEGQPELQVDGFLPAPEADTPVMAQADNVSVSSAEWQKMKTEHQNLMEQTQKLLKILEQQKASSHLTSVNQYADIIDDESHT